MTSTVTLQLEPGCHCDNVVCTGNVCPSDRVRDLFARCSTVIRLIIHNHGVYKQYRKIQPRKFDMC